MKKTLRKSVFALLLAAVMLSSHLTSFAAGWTQFQSGEWMYFNADGSYLADQWVGNYYLDSSGCMLRNSWTADGYWVGNDGAWQPQWGQRYDYAEPWPGKPYYGTYTYVFYKDVYGDGVEHWSVVESNAFQSFTTTYDSPRTAPQPMSVSAASPRPAPSNGKIKRRNDQCLLFWNLQKHVIL